MDKSVEVQMRNEEASRQYHALVVKQVEKTTIENAIGLDELLELIEAIAQSVRDGDVTSSILERINLSRVEWAGIRAKLRLRSHERRP